VGGLRVAELAASSGVPASTVRYYERVGVLSPARRTENGYRIFPPSAVDELAFINQAKGIGMRLEEIADLIAAWRDTECEVLQARLQRFLADRIDQVRSQRAGLDTAEAQLLGVATRLARRGPSPGRCGTNCGCEVDLDVTAGVDLSAGPSVGAATSCACTLDHHAQELRITEWQALTNAATHVRVAGDTARLVLPADPQHVATAARLCAAETACCANTRFVLEINGDEVVLTAEAPGAPGVVQALFQRE